MARRTLRSQQDRWLRGLKRRFGAECVSEWPAFDRSVDRYSPRLDLAVGPFSYRLDENKNDEYMQLAKRHAAFLQHLWCCHAENEAEVSPRGRQSPGSIHAALTGNYNPRCFLAIEIENAVSRKHLMGGIVNAVALGQLGILVAWTDDKLRAMFRARSYLEFLESRGKPTMAVRNLLILTRNQADRAFS
jgi:hypothetical protein